MARPSKAKSPKYAKFAVYEDANANSIPTSDSARQQHSKVHDDEHPGSKTELDVIEEKERYGSSIKLEDVSEDLASFSLIGEQTDTEVDDEDDDEDRRESTFTRRTSISSLPGSSVFDTEYESMMPAMHKPYTPPSMRPTFRRPESVRRMQLMASPTPSERYSPRRSVLHAKSRTGTPRSVKQSPRPRASRYQEEDVEEDKNDFPLVLLHLTLLPVELPWSAESMSNTLPPDVMKNLQLLRSKVSETILHRGILIPHPRAEYELLEERLLEALELQKERVTKCGHFRTRDSTSSISSGEGSVKSADSGVGSSLDGDDFERCTTCSSPVKGTTTAVDKRGRKWSIRVFAANGLMRAPAWTAAWNEMERVDVEILPWISEDLRKQLDAIMEREEEDERRSRHDNDSRSNEVVEEQVLTTYEEKKAVDANERERESRFRQRSHLQEPLPKAPLRTAPRRSDLPQVYRKADIPLSVLLRNYAFLLAQDKRNVAMLSLALLVVWMGLRAAVLQPVDLIQLPSTCEQMPPEMPYYNAAATFTAMSEQGSLDGSAESSTMIDEIKEIVNSPAEPEPNADFHAGEHTIPKEQGSSSLDMTELLIDPGPGGHLEEAVLSDSEENTKQFCVNQYLTSEIFGDGNVL